MRDGVSQHREFAPFRGRWVQLQVDLIEQLGRRIS
jgi:hypothetical protein